MSNFWLNENAFQQEGQASKESFSDGIFDMAPAPQSIQPALTSIQQQEMSPQQQHSGQPFQQGLPHEQQSLLQQQTIDPLIDMMFNDGEFTQFGGGGGRQKQGPQAGFAGKSPHMFMSPSNNTNQFAGQNTQASQQIPSPQAAHFQHQQQQQQYQQNPQQQQQQSLLDQSKREQLLKMRQQILHQQMLQRQQQQDGRHIPQQIQQQKPGDFASFSHGPAKGAQQNFQGMGNADNSPRNPTTPSAMSQMGAQANIGGLNPTSTQAGTPRPTNSSNQGQTSSNGKPSPAQVAQLQHELFQMTLNDFMNRRGTPITQTPVINRKKINLFVLDILGRKIGGPQVVLKHIQMLNQNSTQITEWSSICQKLGLFEGIDAQNNVNARQQIEKQLGSCYLQYILPFEQYSLTEEGQRDIGNRRVQFQRQLIMRLQQQQQQQQQQQSPQAHQDGNLQTQLQHHQQTQQVPQNTALQLHQPENQQRMQQNWQQQQDLQSSQAQGSLQAQQQAKRLNTRPKMLQSNDPGNSANVLQASSQFKSPSIPSQSPHPGVVPSSNAGHMPSPSASIVHSQRKLSQNSTTNNTPPSHVQSPLSQQIHQSKPNIAKRRQSSAAGQTPSQQPETPARITPHESNGHVKPNTIKKYVPIKKESSAYNDWVLKSVSDLGDEIELTKPVYLFAPELGSLNIHALVMSLKNYTRSNPGEASSALNTLLVTTTDPNFAFSLTDAPELLDALVGLGQKILDQITTFEESSSDYVEVRSQVSDAIESTFGKYVDGKSMKGEDVVYVVDSLTGELVADEDSDFEIDDVFSPTPIQRTAEMLAQPEVEFKQCSIPNFISALQCFRFENKHHFSKAQVKGALNNLVFLVDNLITITMTLRNLSFTEQSSRCMSSNLEFKNLVFKIVKEIATRPDAFVLQRKRLCLLKDCLLMLDRNAHFLEVDSMEEAFLTFLLVTSFGPPLEENESRKFSIPSAPFGTFSYLPFSVDVFTKLFVREPKNRALFQAVLSGSLNTASFHLSSGNVVIKPLDHHLVKNLLRLHLNDDESAARTGVLSTRIFKLLMSCIPFTVNGSEYVKFILQRSSTVLQALFGAKLLVDLMNSEDVNLPQNILICHWLTQNTQILLFNFMRNTTCAITECVKFEPRSGEHRVISYVVLKSLILTNTLLANVVNLKRAHQENELECPSEFEACLKIMQDLYRVQPETEFALNTLLAPSVDQDVALEILRFRSLMKNLA